MSRIDQMKCGLCKQWIGMDDDHDCESVSSNDLLAELAELRLYRSEHERLKGELNKILHPNNDGPKHPSFCDLVAYVRKDLSANE